MTWPTTSSFSRREAETLFDGERHILEMVAKGGALSRILDALCRLVEENAEGVLASVLLVDGGCLRHGGAPSLPKAYTDAIDGGLIGPRAGSCGTAAYRGEQVIVSDIMSDPLWADYSAIASQFSLRACWSTPIMSSQGRVMGTFAMYYREPRSPSRRDQEVIARITHIASIAIERAERDAALRQSEARLAEAERELQLTIDTMPVLVATYRPDGTRIFANQTWFDYTGLPLESAIRAEGTDIVHPEDAERVLREWQKSFAAGVPFKAEMRLRRADGEYRWHSAHRVLAHDHAGTAARWYSVGIDIEDRKRAEEALAASERNLKLIIDTIPALTWSARPDGSAEFFNQQYLDYIGFPAEHARDRGWMAAIHPDDLNGLATAWQNLLASGKPGEVEVRLRRHDGEYRWFLFRAAPLHDEDGNIVKWYGLGKDIEDRRRAEEARRLSEGRWKRIVDNSAVGIAVADLEGRFEIANAAFQKLVGFTEEELTKLTYSSITEPAFRDQNSALMDELIRGRRDQFNIEKQYRCKDGHLVWARNNVSLLPGTDGSPRYVMALVEDISSRKIVEESLRLTQARLARAAEVATAAELSVSIAHEVNQPLSGIITNANTCLRMLGADPPNVDGARETARRTLRDGNRASEIVSRLRALFSKKPPALEPIDLNDATREVIALVSNALQVNRVVLRTELADDIPLARGDRVQLQQVILNLVRNAIDAMATVDDRPRLLTIRTERDGSDNVSLTVRDLGIGLQADVAEQLFGPFYTTKIDGMGIGLSVSRSIIQAHGGQIRAEPNEGPGAAVSFSIPSDTRIAAGNRGAASSANDQKNKHFRLISTGLRGGRANIAFDQALIDARREGRIPDTIRFLQFRPSALIGIHQFLSHELKLDYCHANSIETVRRITGGGRLYLDEGQIGWELIFDCATLGLTDLSEVTRRVCEAAALGLQKLGVPARYRPRHDIEVDGRKISGTGGFFDSTLIFYQGTLLIDFDPEKMLACLRVPADKLAKHGIDSAAQRVISLREVLGHVPDLQSIHQSLADGFAEGLGITPLWGEITAYEEELAARAYDNEIGTDEFVRLLDAPPKGDSHRSASLTGRGGTLRADIRLEGSHSERIREALITGDFFITPPRIVFDLESSLRGLNVADAGPAVDAFFAAHPTDFLSVSANDFRHVIELALGERD